MIYLDANASEPLRPQARAAAMAAMGLGNPSSVHASGRAARAVLDGARDIVAGYFGAKPGDVIFCSGATEANALAIRAMGAGRAVMIGATEHDAVREAVAGVVSVPVLHDGTVDMTALEAMLAAHPPALVCLMAANNETGVFHDIAAAAHLCAAHGALLHVDAVQAAGRVWADWLGMGAASLAVSGHKIGGPPGAGALVVSRDREIIADLRGGGQEGRRRGGTPALPAIAGMAAALGGEYDAAAIGGFRDAIENFCTGLGAIVLGAGVRRLPNTSCLALPGVAAQTQLIALDMAGFAVSAGSACSSGRVGPSHVLAAMGAGALAGCAIRVSLPWNVTADAVPGFCAAYQAMAARTLRGRVVCD